MGYRGRIIKLKRVQDIPDKELIPCGKRLVLGIPIIDSQHKELVVLANELNYKCLRHNKDTVKEGFVCAVRGSINYVKVHFSTEEKIMERVGFPGLEQHKLQHQGFIAKILEEIEGLESGHALAPNRFVIFLKDWVLSHIAISDKEMVDYVLAEAAKRNFVAETEQAAKAS